MDTHRRVLLVDDVDGARVAIELEKDLALARVLELADRQQLDVEDLALAFARAQDGLVLLTTHVMRECMRPCSTAHIPPPPPRALPLPFLTLVRLHTCSISRAVSSPTSGPTKNWRVGIDDSLPYSRMNSMYSSNTLG